MNIKSFWSVALAVAVSSCRVPIVSAAEPSQEEATLVAKLITAHEKLDYDAFVGDSGVPLKKEPFGSIATRLAPRLQAGHEILPLEALRQRGGRVTGWKVSFKDGGDDLLVTLSIRDGK